MGCRDAFSSVPLLASTPLLRAVTAHTLLQSLLVNCVWYERAAAASEAFDTSAGRLAFFSYLNGWVGGITLIVQILLFARVSTSKYIGPVGTLVAEPLMLIVGLLITMSLPSLLAVAIMDCSRTIAARPFLPTPRGLSLPPIASPTMPRFVHVSPRAR